MSAVVVIPWWPGTTDPNRSRWRDQVTALWISWGFEVILGVGYEGAGRNRGIEAAISQGARTIIVCDADSIITKHQALDAIAASQEAHGLVVPHDRYVYLGEQACMGLNAELAHSILLEQDRRWPFVEEDTPLIEFVGDLGVGGPTVFSVETWKRAGGYDENLIRAYDGAFALACGTLVGEQRRIEGDYLHFWHPRIENETAETWEVMRQYHEAAVRGRMAMLDLTDARKALRE